jgi:P-type conjugative transfer ATPase TrbB
MTTQQTIACRQTPHDITFERTAQMLKTALGEIEQFLHDKKVIEIMLNPDGFLWIEKLGEGRISTGIKIRPENAERFICMVASATNTTCTYENPILSTELPGYGSRFEALLPPVVSSPTFAIRQPAVMVFTLRDYVEKDIMTAKQYERIVWGIEHKENILIVGGTGSGKTTLTNAALDVIAEHNDRIVIIQDTLELQCTADDTVFLRSQDHVSITRLLKSTMRLRPDRIVVGEVRDGAALALLKAWNTGHPGGLATIHANSAYEGLIRLEQLIQEVNVTPQQRLIGQAVNLLVYIERFGHGRKIQEVCAVKGFDKKENDYILEVID